MLGLSLFFVGTSIASAQALPTPDLSVWNSANMKPVRDFANLTVGVIFGVATLVGVVMIAFYGLKLQSSGSDLMKSQEAKSGLKATLVGLFITFMAVFIVGIILYALTTVGIKTS